MNDPNYNDALQDFTEARLKASMQEILARLRGQSNELLSYDEVAKKLRLSARAERGIQQIPLDSIVGSVGRYTDFTRSFMPKANTSQERWARVKAAIDNPAGPGWPPIDVYKVGEVYFVLDGNHRVSVARQEGFATIEAHVIEIKTSVSLTADVQPDDLIIKAEYAAFLEATGFDNLRPGVDLSVSVPGQYEHLLEHIKVHQYFMGIDFKRDDVTYEEAVAHWYDAVYLPLTEPIRERGVLRWFPGRTETDLYIWVSEHRAVLEEEIGWKIRPEAAAEDLAIRLKRRTERGSKKPGQWRESKMFDRYTDRLFRDVLVAFSGSPSGWLALEQAILVAQKENARIQGLHVHTQKPTPHEHPEDLADSFSRRCAQEGIQEASLSTTQGDVPNAIVERGLLNDLIVLNVSHPPEPGIPGLGSGLRAIISRAARPVLTIPGKTSPMDRILVGYDGSQKSHEALFVATYLAEKWQSTISVLTLENNQKRGQKIQQQARAYLDLHEIQANYILQKITPGAFGEVIEAQGINLVAVGSYGRPAWREIFVGSTVSELLREARCAVLICR